MTMPRVGRRRWRLVEQLGQVLLGLPVEPGHQAIQVGIGPDLGRVEEQLLAPDQTGRLAQLDDLLEETLEDLDAETSPDPGQAGVIGQRLVQGVAEVPAMGQVHAGQLDQLALRADPLEEHDQLELEEDDRIDARPPAFLIGAARQVTDERQVELGLEMAVEMVSGNQGVQ
jgi:hypothetical protein